MVSGGKVGIVDSINVGIVSNSVFLHFSAFLSRIMSTI